MRNDRSIERSAGTACVVAVLLAAAACDTPTAPSPAAAAVEAPPVLSSAVAQNERVPLTFVVPADACPVPPGNELIVTEGFTHVLRQDGPNRVGVHFAPNNLQGVSIPSGFKYVATGPSHRVTLETSSGIVKQKFFSVINLMSARGTDVRVFALLKLFLDPDGNLDVRVDVLRAECF